VNLTLYAILLIAALAATAFVLWIGSTGGVGSMQVGPRVGIVISVATFLLWGLLAIESFEIVVASGGSELKQSYEELAWLALGGAMICLASAFKASVEEIKETGGVM